LLALGLVPVSLLEVLEEGVFVLVPGKVWNQVFGDIKPFVVFLFV
jgi:hypothetical protein